MSQVKVKWVQGKQFVGTDSTGHSLVMSSSEEGTGLKPSDLLLLGLGGCTGVDVISILEKQHQKVTDLEVMITGEQDPDPPWTFRRIEIEYLLRGEGLKEEAVRRAIQLSEEKYCSVGATISGVAEMASSFQIVEE
ncbi:MAG TPA: osmotically inducible protein OsmC [Chloroflexi bacterium]|nr:osmotically inducible protein OsmC [Chloroflexota bacterium]